MDDLSESISVPFLSEEFIDRGKKGENQQNIEALIKQEFGDLSGLVVLPNKVTLNGRAIVDLTDPEPNLEKIDHDSVIKSEKDPEIVSEFDRPSPPSHHTRERAFTLRMVDSGTRLRIAVHVELNQSHRHDLRNLLNDIKHQGVESFEIDLGRCREISVTGIGILLLIKENTGADRENIVLKHCRRGIVEKLLWASMENYFRIMTKDAD